PVEQKTASHSTALCSYMQYHPAISQVFYMYSLQFIRNARAKTDALFRYIHSEHPIQKHGYISRCMPGLSGPAPVFPGLGIQNLIKCFLKNGISNLLCNKPHNKLPVSFLRRRLNKSRVIHRPCSLCEMIFFYVPGHKRNPVFCNDPIFQNAYGTLLLLSVSHTKPFQYGSLNAAGFPYSFPVGPASLRSRGKISISRIPVLRPDRIEQFFRPVCEYLFFFRIQH